MLDTFRESQNKYGSHLEEPLGLIRPEGYHQKLSKMEKSNTKKRKLTLVDLAT